MHKTSEKFPFLEHLGLLIDKMNFIWFVMWFPIAVAISPGGEKKRARESS
jgi:hypothetical protein